MYYTCNLSISGSINAAPTCGLAGGTFLYTYPGRPTCASGNSSLRVLERIPTGENSSFASWASQYGAVTTAMFNAALTSPGYNFGGRKVEQVSPASPAGKDGCYWSDAPWPQPITSLAQPGAVWYVQNNNSAGNYGPDNVGLGSNIVAVTQARSPSMANGSCTIQYPQQMEINSETGGTGYELYGGNGTGLNILKFVVTPTSFSVSRGNASSGSLTFYF